MRRSLKQLTWMIGWVVNNYPAPIWQKVRRHSPALYFTATAVSVVGVLTFFNVLPLLLEAEGVSSFFVSALLGVISLFVTFLFAYYIDRFEPEPRWPYLVPLLWVGGIAVTLAFVLNTWWHETFTPMLLGEDASGNAIVRFPTSVGAPVNEEFVKSLGVIVIFFAFRRFVNGRADGFTLA